MVELKVSRDWADKTMAAQKRLMEEDVVEHLTRRGPPSDVAGWLYDLGNASFYSGLYSSVNVSKAADVLASFVLAAQSKTAIIWLAAHRGGDNVKVELFNDVVQLAAPLANEYASAGTWKTAFFLSYACRRDELLDSLCDVSTDVSRQSTTKSEEYAFMFQDALKSFYLKESEPIEQALNALALTLPDKLQHGTEEYAAAIAASEIDLFYLALRGEQEGFDESLRKGLAAHRIYWSKKSRRNDPAGFIAVGLTAIAAIGFDLGMSLNVETDLCPRWLVEGQFASTD